MSADDGLPVGMTERRVVDEDVLLGDALGLQVRLEDLVGGAGIDVVRPGQHPAFGTEVVHQVVHRRNRLLVRRGTRVEDVLRRLLTLVLHRIEQHAVQFLEHRQHGLARHRCPAAEDHIDLLLLDEFARLLSERAASRRLGPPPPLRVAGPKRPPAAFCCSTSMRTVSLSVVSLMAMVPERECSTPTLMGSAWANAAGANAAVAASRSAAPLWARRRTVIEASFT